MYTSPKPMPFEPPEGCRILYVPLKHPHMVAAASAIELSGCAKHPVGAALVKDNRVFQKGANGSMKFKERHPECRRQELKCPTGTGYEHCPNCVTPGHAEAMVISRAQKAGYCTNGADLYLFGHWWCCEPCWNVMLKAGVRDVYLVERATELFDKPEGTRETLLLLMVTVD